MRGSFLSAPKCEDLYQPLSLSQLCREGALQSKMQSTKKYLKMEKILDFTAKSSVLESKTNLIHWNLRDGNVAYKSVLTRSH